MWFRIEMIRVLKMVSGKAREIPRLSVTGNLSE